MRPVWEMHYCSFVLLSVTILMTVTIVADSYTIHRPTAEEWRRYLHIAAEDDTDNTEAQVLKRDPIGFGGLSIGVSTQALQDKLLLEALAERERIRARQRIHQYRMNKESMGIQDRRRRDPNAILLNS
ncbi:uncharacterized protein [Ptychodera flava]|uniref:uncharacterized protein n=1 Tax=Ptychodera flava TaxID=63121 RepID=UPI00396A7EB4